MNNIWLIFILLCCCNKKKGCDLCENDCKCIGRMKHDGCRKECDCKKDYCPEKMHCVPFERSTESRCCEKQDCE